MQNSSDVKKFIRSNKKLKFNGYQSIKRYLMNFSDEELDYLEISFIVGKESSERLMAFKDIVPICIAIYAVIAALIPDIMKNNSLSFSSILGQFSIVFVIALLIFLFLNNYPSKDIDTYRTGIEIIKKIKAERNP
ncbi:hypothetical protein [Hungatella hathewayi]|uniref:hypothetical protein n=1 Tax=Hungatella hathewayi TaxID=154046 RepID=UPI00356971CA